MMNRIFKYFITLGIVMVLFCLLGQQVFAEAYKNIRFEKFEGKERVPFVIKELTPSAIDRYLKSDVKARTWFKSDENAKDVLQIVSSLVDVTEIDVIGDEIYVYCPWGVSDSMDFLIIYDIYREKYPNDPYIFWFIADNLTSKKAEFRYVFGSELVSLDFEKGPGLPKNQEHFFIVVDLKKYQAIEPSDLNSAKAFFTKFFTFSRLEFNTNETGNFVYELQITP